MLPKGPPPIFGLNTHRSRVEHKLSEARYFYERLLTKDIRYRKLATQKAWRNARDELNEWMFLASAFISATRSTYYYLQKATKAKSDHRQWLRTQELLPIHEIGKKLRDFMLHEAMPNAGYEVELPPAKPGESKGEWVARGLLLEQHNPRIAITVTEVLPTLTPNGAALAASYKANVSELLAAILRGVEQLVADADRLKMLSDNNIGPGVSTNRKP